MARERDKYYGAPVALSDPANEAVPITPGEPLDETARAIYVGTGGNLMMRGGDDTAMRTWKNVPDGTMLPFRVDEVGVGSTATDLLALY